MLRCPRIHSYGVHCTSCINDVEYASLEWVDCFNHRRRLEPIGNILPAEFENGYYQQLDGPGFAA